MSQEPAIASVSGENLAAWDADTQQLSERGEAQYKFTAQGLTCDDWEALRPQLREHGYRLFVMKDWTYNLEGLREDGIELDEVELNQVVHTIGDYMSLFGAFRLSDDTRVVLKIIVDNPSSREREVLEYLNSPKLRHCPANATIPLLDSFSLYYGGTLLHVLVMEDCPERPFNEPETLFSTAENWYRFILRIFEGVNFMHEHGIAHLDMHPRNILGKEGLQSIQDIYIADFGGSQYFPGPVKEALCYHPTYLLDCPESPYNAGSAGRPFNPFAVDVYGVGWICARADGVDASLNPPPLMDLFKKMMSDIPEERPTMVEALNELRRIILETLLYPDRHAPATVKGDQDEVVAEGASIPLPTSPDQHIEDFARGEHILPQL